MYIIYKMETLVETSKLALKKGKNFTCKACDYITTRKSSMDKHKLTAKHQKLQKVAEKLQRLQKVASSFPCPYCSKFYESKGGKYKHMKKCFKNPKQPQILSQVKWLEKELKREKEHSEIMRVRNRDLETEKLKLENKYLKEQVEVLENNKGNTQNINTQNNNYFNIQVYLDEKCKNAMPIMDFIRDLQFKLTDINPERPSSTIESLSKCITDKLEDMDETERPVHCSDAKRLVFHVKDASGWTKDINNKKMDKAIGWANMRHQGAWIKKATSEDMVNQKNDLDYLNMNVAMGKYSDDPSKAKKRIKRAIAKAVPIKKS